MMICKYCKKFSLESLKRRDYAHQPSTSALKASAEQGCGLCMHMYECIKQTLEIGSVSDLPGGVGRMWIQQTHDQDRPDIERHWLDVCSGRQHYILGRLKVVANEGKSVSNAFRKLWLTSSR
jgi:hypothetical protein